MPYAIIQRATTDIVISAGSAENAYRLTLGLVELDTRNVREWDNSIYENSGSFKVCDGVYIKGDDTDFSVYKKRGIAIWIDEKCTKDCMTQKFELAYLTDKALAPHYKLGNIRYNSIRVAILAELQELETHEEKIERLIDIINERYYTRNGFDEYGRYVTSRDEVKAPFNLFGLSHL